MAYIELMIHYTAQIVGTFLTLKEAAMAFAHHFSAQ